MTTILWRRSTQPILLDTIPLLWWLGAKVCLSVVARNRIVAPLARVFVSVATAWEISALERAGRLDFGRPARDCLPAEIVVHRFEWLALDQRHIFMAQELPRDSLDPYDRLIVAQATIEGLELVTTNMAMQLPGVSVIDAWPDLFGPARPPAATARPNRGTPPGRPRTDRQTADPIEVRPLPTWNAFPWGRTTDSPAALETLEADHLEKTEETAGMAHSERPDTSDSGRPDTTDAAREADRSNDSLAKSD